MSGQDPDRSLKRALAEEDVVAEFDPLPINPRKPSEEALRPWMMEADAAAYLGITKRALERRRGRGTGPAHHGRYGVTAYYEEDLDAWIASRPKGYRGPPA